MSVPDVVAYGSSGLPGRKLHRSFYLRPAMDCVTSFLGKALVRQTTAGRLAGIIQEVEAYPAFVDGVHRGNRRTARSEVMWHAGGRAYVYLVYGLWHQFAAVVNEEGVPDVVFIRGVVPVEGMPVMTGQWDKPMAPSALANSPGKLCKSFLITKQQYGADLCGDELFLEDWEIAVPDHRIHTGKRVGISTTRQGHDAPLRFFVKPEVIVPPRHLTRGVSRDAVRPGAASQTAAP